jgi:hypothetical protein
LRKEDTTTVALAEANPTAIVTAILAGKTILAGMLFDALFRLLRNIHFTLQAGY